MQQGQSQTSQVRTPYMQSSHCTVFVNINSTFFLHHNPVCTSSDKKKKLTQVNRFIYQFCCSILSFKFWIKFKKDKKKQQPAVSLTSTIFFTFKLLLELNLPSFSLEHFVLLSEHFDH